MSRTTAALLAGELDKSHTENGRLLQREGGAFGGKQLVRKTSCVFCLRTQTRAGAQPNGQARSVRCPFGLIETTVPIRLSERVIGFFAPAKSSLSHRQSQRAVHGTAPKISTFLKM
jgi:hypothetical protein